MNERSFVFLIDGKSVAADDNPQTHFWIAKVRGVREGFKAGDQVGVRIKTDVSPAELRELSDSASWSWLTAIRKDPMGGVVIKADAKWLSVKLDDGSSFTYKVTAKSSAQIDGASKPVSALVEGTHVFVKGRLTSTLETSAAMVTDTRPDPEVKKGRTKRSTPLRLAANGKVRGIVETLHTSLRMFDVNVDDRLLHITYARDTKFLVNGTQAFATDVQKGAETVITYRRDGYGRLIASKVELFVRVGF